MFFNYCLKTVGEVNFKLIAFFKPFLVCVSYKKAIELTNFISYTSKLNLILKQSCHLTRKRKKAWSLRNFIKNLGKPGILNKKPKFGFLNNFTGPEVELHFGSKIYHINKIFCHHQKFFINKYI